jgi:Relaxase/Mobilisation nuclease domain
MEDQDGAQMTSLDERRAVLEQWQNDTCQRFVSRLDEDEKGKREAFHVMLSMPAGTNPVAMREAVQAFLANEFGGDRNYVFAQHDDEPHPHVHVMVQAAGYDGRRLNPRKADLQRWREGFAEQLNAHGIRANATKRQARGVTKRAVPQRIVHARRRGQIRETPERPMPANLQRRQTETARAVGRDYGVVAKALIRSPEANDQRLARDIVQFVAAIGTRPAAHAIDSATDPQKVLAYVSRLHQSSARRYGGRQSATSGVRDVSRLDVVPGGDAAAVLLQPDAHDRVGQGAAGGAKVRRPGDGPGGAGAKSK